MVRGRLIRRQLAIQRATRVAVHRLAERATLRLIAPRESRRKRARCGGAPGADESAVDVHGRDAIWNERACARCADGAARRTLLGERTGRDHRRVARAVVPEETRTNLEAPVARHLG